MRLPCLRGSRAICTCAQRSKVNYVTSLTAPPLVPSRRRILYERVAKLLAVLERSSPDEWASKNRDYPRTAAIPGPRDPYLTPYIVPVESRTAQRPCRMGCPPIGQPL